MNGPGMTTMPSSASSPAARRYDSARARARLRNMTATAAPAPASASAAAAPAGAEMGSPRRMTACEYSPTAASTGVLAAANAASSASAAVLHPASATVADVSSQVAWRGSSRAASGRAAAPASAGMISAGMISAGTISGRYRCHMRLLPPFSPVTIRGRRVPVASQQAAQQPGITPGEPGHEPAQPCTAGGTGAQRMPHPAGREAGLIDWRVGEPAPDPLARQQALRVQPGNDGDDRAVRQFSLLRFSLLRCRELLADLAGAERPARLAKYPEDLGFQRSCGTPRRASRASGGILGAVIKHAGRLLSQLSSTNPVDALQLL